MDIRYFKIYKKHLFCEKVYYDYFNKVINLNNFDICKNWHPFELREEYVERINKINTTYFVFI